MAIVTGKLCKVVVVVMMAMLAVAVSVLPSDFWWQGSGSGLVWSLCLSDYWSVRSIGTGCPAAC